MEQEQQDHIVHEWVVRIGGNVDERHDAGDDDDEEDRVEQNEGNMDEKVHMLLLRCYFFPCENFGNFHVAGT